MGGQNRFPPQKTKLARVKKNSCTCHEKQHLSREIFLRKDFWGNQRRSKNFDTIQGFLEIEKYKKYFFKFENGTQDDYYLSRLRGKLLTSKIQQCKQCTLQCHQCDTIVYTNDNSVNSVFQCKQCTLKCTLQCTLQCRDTIVLH